MTLYLDSSAIVKLLVVETASAQVRTAVEETGAVATHLITYAEVCAALVRQSREMADPSLFWVLRTAFDRVWRQCDLVMADEGLMRRAGVLAERFALRGYDSVQLAAAEAVAETLSRPADLMFGCFDRRLTEAGAALGFRLLDGE